MEKTKGKYNIEGIDASGTKKTPFTAINKQE